MAKRRVNEDSSPSLSLTLPILSKSTPQFCRIWMDSGQYTIALRGAECPNFVCQKNVLLYDCTVIYLGGSRTALSRNIKRVMVKNIVLLCSISSNFTDFGFDIVSPGHSRSICSQRRPRPPPRRRASQDGRGVGLQCDGGQGAELAHLHLSHHPRGCGRPTPGAEERGPVALRQRHCKIHEV